MKFPLQLRYHNDLVMLVDAEDNDIAATDDTSFTVEEDRQNLQEIVNRCNAFDVIMQRGWAVRKYLDGWIAVSRELDPWEDHAILKDEEGMEDWNVVKLPNPFTALIEADKWYKENIEEKK